LLQFGDAEDAADEDCEGCDEETCSEKNQSAEFLGVNLGTSTSRCSGLGLTCDEELPHLRVVHRGELHVQSFRAAADAQAILHAKYDEQKKRSDLASQAGYHDVDAHVAFLAVIGSCSDGSAGGLQDQGAVVGKISL